LGLVIWSSRGNVQSSRLKQLVIDLGADHGVVETLVASRDVSSVYAWLSLTGSPRPAIAGLTRRISEMRDVRVGVGEPQTGLAGFKATHEQALVARRLAQYPGSQKRRVIRYHDIAAATLLVKHPEDADPWTAEILGGLAGPGQDVERLRETLRVYLESGENASRAAVQLYVHRNTVKYRVASALELLGVPLEHNRLSVALALNYHHVAMGHD
ncbi:MAG: helix-turn-helix domain-containing protein, partial [Propionibacteriaceae bacterium]|nr:helix-turn-helix domain-containing protein [Propionibacteriaceae bacterium]